MSHWPQKTHRQELMDEAGVLYDAGKMAEAILDLMERIETLERKCDGMRPATLPRVLVPGDV